MPKPNLPIGYDNFSDIIRRNMHFVDKSLFIKDFLDNDPVQVSLITRPRRFGKSLNLSMLHHFFADFVIGIPTLGLFDGLKIALEGGEYMRHQGQYPVIALSLKDIKERNFEDACANLASVLANTFSEHRTLLVDPNIPDEKRIEFEKILYQKGNRATLENALANLSACLFLHTGKKPIILIDEYDTPIQSGYMQGYYEEIIGFMRNFFGKALKSNLYFERAVLTGILRVSKESLFSGLNNLEVYSMFRPEYSDYFGFTEAEVTDLFTQSDFDLSLDEVREWYNGYQVGNTVIYNPWSIVNCINQKGLLRPYWVNTSGHDILKHAIAKADAEFKMSMESLMAGIPVERMVDENFVFANLDENEGALWSLLLASGYLKAIQAMPEDGLMQCHLLFPNKEVAVLYKSLFMQWFSDKLGYGGYERFLGYLLKGHIEDFSAALQDFLLESASSFDVKGTHPEKFYHGFVLGLIASLREEYSIQSNRESGHGRYDVMLIPKDKEKLGLVLEFKTAKAAEDLDTVAKQALQQVKDKQYASELKQAGIQSILKLGFAFKGKEVAVVYE